MTSSVRFKEGGKRLNDNHIKAPYFSIITVTYNNIATLPRCLDAILCQSFKNLEVIIVDGGSNDGTQEFLSERNSDIDYFVSEPDSGIYNAINKGVSLANGRVIGLIHSDDILSFNSLSRYHLEFKKNAIDMVLGDCCYINNELRFTNYKPARNYGVETIFRGITGAHEAIFIKKEAYKKIGLYDETYRSAADFKLISAMVLAGLKIGMTKELEVYKLIGGESFSKEIEFNENYRLAKEYLPSLTVPEYETLLKLKNYRDRSKTDIKELYKVISSLEASSSIFRALCLSLVTIMLGDSKDDTFNRDQSICSFDREDYSPNRILFGIVGIKGVSGGAERVLIDLASHLANTGKEVLLTSADGKAGVPYYTAGAPMDLIDIYEPPYNNKLDVNYDLKSELVDVVNKLPDALLIVVNNCQSLRDEFENWSQFSNLCDAANKKNITDIRQLLLSEVDAWVKKHGGRVSRWRTLINRYKPGVVVPFMISATTQMFIAARKTRAKIVLSNHGNPIRDYLYQDDWDNSLLDRALRMFSIMAAQKVHWLHADFLDLISPQAKQKSVVIANPVTAFNTNITFNQKKNIILGVGRLIALKRFHLLIKAFSNTQLTREWELHIYGEGPEHDKLLSLIIELGMQNKVFLKGRTTKIFDRYAESSLLVSCSKMEGFGLTVAEAMASGLPVIAPKSTSGLNDLVKDNVNGLLIDDSDEAILTANLSNAISELISNSLLRESLAKNAVNSMNKYSEENIFREWSSLLDEL